jgi:hypothetical protein
MSLPLGFDTWIFQLGVTILPMLSWSTLCVCKPDVIVFQLEVLELLAHHGADLNAKTKHEETPAGELLVSQSHPGNLALHLKYVAF